MIKLLAIDMDGTCLTSRKKITNKTMSALQQAADKGIIIVPATGRAMDCLPRQLMGKALYRYVIASNGARVYDVKERKTLYSSLISKKDAINLLLEGKRHGLGLVAHINNQTIVEGTMLNLKARLVYKKDTEDTIKTKDIIREIKKRYGNVEELQFFFFNEREKWWTKDLVQKNKNFSTDFGRIYAEMYSKNTSKGIALRSLAAFLGIEKSEIMCIGNGENDLTMFGQSGLKIAVDNAESALKEQADCIVASNNGNGVAEAIQKFCL